MVPVWYLQSLLFAASANQLREQIQQELATNQTSMEKAIKLLIKKNLQLK